jgi:ABC-type branched-subunit amino acid transport system substrate-binding protein
VAPARSTLFTPAENTIGITPTSITMCAHAALTYGAAFNTTADDFNVFWTALNKEQGGVFGRQVKVTYENDNYSPTEAVTAARACKAKNPFILLGGIGFDQIPAVRNYVEKEHMLYMHHTATIKGSEGLKYSFTGLPTVERTGEAFAQLAASKYKDKKIGIIKRDGANWEPGVVAFKALAKKAGLNIVAERAVAANKGNYTDELLAMRNAGVEVVWGWENALISTQMIAQAKKQNYNPAWLLFPFNLTSQTLDGDAMNPPLDGVAMFTAFSKGDRGGPFAAYADDLTLYERQYAKYRPDADLSGVGGDLLFLNWQAQKALYDMLLECGRDCTRNRMVDTLTTYKKLPTSSACPIDFTRGDRRHGAEFLTFMQTYKSPSGKVNWRNTQQCVGRP